MPHLPSFQWFSHLGRVRRVARLIFARTQKEAATTKLADPLNLSVIRLGLMGSVVAGHLSGIGGFLLVRVPLYRSVSLKSIAAGNG